MFITLETIVSNSYCKGVTVKFCPAFVIGIYSYVAGDLPRKFN